MTDKNPEELLREARVFAETRLGPESAAFLEDPAQGALVLSRVRRGAELEDAVLGVVHEASGERQALASEFLGFFFDEFVRTTGPTVSGGLRRLVDTEDLLVSVAGDMWPEVSDLRFDNRGAFLRLLGQRLKWKAGDRVRQRRHAGRREDLRIEMDPVDIDPAGDVLQPPEQLIGQEEKEQLESVLQNLSERDAALVRMHLEGEGVEAMMELLDASRPTTRRALLRALERTRKLAGEAWARGGEPGDLEGEADEA